LRYLNKAADRREKPGKNVSNNAVCGLIGIDDEFISRLEAILSIEGWCSRAAWVAAAVRMKSSIRIALLGGTRKVKVEMVKLYSLNDEGRERKCEI